MPEHRSLQDLTRAKRQAKTLVLKVSGVQGVGIGDGTVRVYISHASVARELPADIDGVPVEPVTVGEVTLHD